MPGQWAGRGETTGHSASMLTPMILHCTFCISLYLCRDALGIFLAPVKHNLKALKSSLSVKMPLKAHNDFSWSHTGLMLCDTNVFFLPVIHKWSYFGSPCWSQSELLSKLHRVNWGAMSSFTSVKHYSLQAQSVLSQRAIWCISQPKKNRCALIMHHHFLTICWLNTTNRCANSAWIILCLLILSACSGLFSLPCYDIWCLLTVLLLLCSVDHLCSGGSAHTDRHSHGGKAAATHHSQVSIRTSEVCMHDQPRIHCWCSYMLDYASFMFYWKRQDDMHTFTNHCDILLIILMVSQWGNMVKCLQSVRCFQLMNDCRASLYSATRSRQSHFF